MFPKGEMISKLFRGQSVRRSLGAGIVATPISSESKGGLRIPSWLTPRLLEEQLQESSDG